MGTPDDCTGVAITALYFLILACVPDLSSDLRKFCLTLVALAQGWSVLYPLVVAAAWYMSSDQESDALLWYKYHLI